MRVPSRAGRAWQRRDQPTCSGAQVFWCEPCALVQERKELMLRDKLVRHPTVAATVVVPNAANGIYNFGSPDADPSRPRSGGSERGMRKVAPNP